MSYTPTQWSAGDIVTSAKLNKMEQGIASVVNSGNTLIVNIAYDYEGNAILDKTWEEIRDAGIAILRESSEPGADEPVVTSWYFITEASSGMSNLTGRYYFIEADGYRFQCSSPNDYPQYSESAQNNTSDTEEPPR